MGRAITDAEFEELYRQSVRDVFAFVRRRSSGDAEDLVAEVYSIAWQRRRELPAALLRRAWLFAVARNLIRADGRRQRRDAGLVTDAARRSDAGFETARGDAAEDGTTAQVLNAALDRLAPAEREVLRLAAWEHLTPAEIAVVLGVRPGTARVRLHRARQALASDPAIRGLVKEPALPVPR